MANEGRESIEETRLGRHRCPACGHEYDEPVPGPHCPACVEHEDVQDSAPLRTRRAGMSAGNVVPFPRKQKPRARHESKRQALARQLAALAERLSRPPEVPTRPWPAPARRVILPGTFPFPSPRTRK